MVVDTCTVVHDGIKYRVVATYDELTQPEDFDCFDAADRAAWMRDEWSFVTLLVSVDGIEAQASLGAVVWGKLPGRDRWLDFSYYRDDIVVDLMADARALARETRDRLNAMSL